MGGVFGLVRGLLLVVVGVYLVQMTSAAEAAAWQQSTIVHALQPAAAWLSNLVSPGLETLKTKVGDTLQNSGQFLQDIKGKVGSAL